MSGGERALLTTSPASLGRSAAQLEFVFGVGGGIPYYGGRWPRKKLQDELERHGRGHRWWEGADVDQQRSVSAVTSFYKEWGLEDNGCKL